MLTGGCFCGAIRYQTAGPAFDQTNCHCSICRRTTGAPFVAWFTVPATTFRWLQGTPTRFRSSDRGTRCFCPACGTQLTFQLDEVGNEIDVTTCSLDNPDTMPPADHSHTARRLTWIRLNDALPDYPEGRPGS